MALAPAPNPKICGRSSSWWSPACQAGYCFYVEPEGIWSFWVPQNVLVGDGAEVGSGMTWEKLYGPLVVVGRWPGPRFQVR